MPCYRVRVVHDGGVTEPVITAPTAAVAEQRAREIVRLLGRTPLRGGRVERLHDLGRTHR